VTSADGRARAFSAEADGIGWAEGVGVLVVQRLSDARREGREVLAVIRSSAVNQDGASNGLTAPSGPSQERLIRRALALAGLKPSDVDAVEGSANGSTVGDPIEANALIAAYGRDRPADRPLLVGSVKSNIGHTQAASGVAGVIKMVLALRNGRLPMTRYADAPTPRVDWSAGRVALLAETVPWPDSGRPRRAGVSSFGMSGTNAHVIVEQAPAQPPDDPAEPTGDRNTAVSWLLSARSPQALPLQAERLLTHLAAHPDLDPHDIGYSLATSRTPARHRAAVVGADRDELVAGLTAIARGEGTGSTRPGARTAFLFAGETSVPPGAGRLLCAAFPVFAQAFNQVSAMFDSYLDRPLRDVLLGETAVDARQLTQPAFAHAATFTIQVALFRLFEFWGQRPDYLLGHSAGELAAAHVAGVLSLADAVKLTAHRGQLLQDVPGGAMVAVAASAAEVGPLLGDRVSIAAVNGPASVVLSGDRDAVLALADHFAERGRTTEELTTRYAGHSARVDEILDELGEVAEELSYDPPRLPMVSTVTGAPLTDEPLTAAYWVDNCRQPVRLADGVRALEAAGVSRFVELGPDGALAELARAVVDGADTVLALGVLASDQNEVVSALRTAGRLHVDGLDLDTARLFVGQHVKRVPLPPYAFHRTRYWPAEDTEALHAKSLTMPDAARPAPAAPVEDGPSRPDPDALRARLAGLPARRQEKVLLELVCGHAAAVLGYADTDAIEPDQQFLEVGFDSVAAVRLRTSLSEASGLSLPATAIFDYRTPAALAAFLLAELDRPGATDGASADPASDGLRQLFVESVHAGRVRDGLAVLNSAARLRTAFVSARDAGDLPVPVRLAEGPAAPRLIALPTPVSMGGVYQYAKLAAHFRGTREFAALPVPGFGPGELLPATGAAVVDVLAESVRAHTGDEPFALLGYSAGGVLAHGVAAALERSGCRPAAVVLLDAYAVRGEDVQGADQEERTEALLAQAAMMVDDEHLHGSFDRTKLTAMARYLELMPDVPLVDVEAPTLLLRAADRFRIGPADEQDVSDSWRTTWSRADEFRTVPGDHFSMIEASTAATAEAVQDWLSTLPGGGPRKKRSTRSGKTRR
jgi:acyl transferase domain-containing protein/thioesterase domain-containing protein